MGARGITALHALKDILHQSEMGVESRELKCLGTPEPSKTVSTYVLRNLFKCTIKQMMLGYAAKCTISEECGVFSGVLLVLTIMRMWITQKQTN